MTVRPLIAAASGVIAGVLLALLSIELLRIDRFALTPLRVLVGYLEVAALGAGLALTSRIAPRSAIRRAVLGGALGVGLSFAARIWLTPWTNLYAIGAGGGPAGELPLVVLPCCGVVLAAAFFWPRSASRGVG